MSWRWAILFASLVGLLSPARAEDIRGANPWPSVAPPPVIAGPAPAPAPVIVAPAPLLAPPPPPQPEMPVPTPPPPAPAVCDRPNCEQH